MALILYLECEYHFGFSQSTSHIPVLGSCTENNPQYCVNFNHFRTLLRFSHMVIQIRKCWYSIWQNEKNLYVVNLGGLTNTGIGVWSSGNENGVVWCDESLFRVFRHNRRLFIRRCGNERLLAQWIVHTIDGSGSVTVWDCFGYLGTGTLHPKLDWKIMPFLLRCHQSSRSLLSCRIMIRNIHTNCA